MKSAYELERDANIARNQEKLKELGLLGDNTLKEKAPAAPRAPQPPVVPVPDECKRRSSRVSKKPVHLNALTDAFFDEEERELNGEVWADVRRSAGSRKRCAPASFQEEQGRACAEHGKFPYEHACSFTITGHGARVTRCSSVCSVNFPRGFIEVGRHLVAKPAIVGARYQNPATASVSK